MIHLVFKYFEHFEMKFWLFWHPQNYAITSTNMAWIKLSFIIICNFFLLKIINFFIKGINFVAK